MKTKLIAILMGLAVITGIFAAGGQDASVIEVGGSTSVTPLMEMFAAEYAKVKPDIKINISGTGSGDGIANAGVTYQIGMSSRELTASEQGRGLNAVTVAIDGIAVIVNRSNPVNNLTIQEIRDIYTGAITDWSQVSGGAKRGRIAVISREEGSGTRGAFEEIIGFQGRLVRGANQLTSTGAIKASVVSNPDSIGYISLGSVDNTVQALSVGGVSAVTANVVNGTYKIARPFIVLTGRNVNPETTAFINWMMSAQGQAIVRRSWIAVR